MSNVAIFKNLFKQFEFYIFLTILCFIIYLGTSNYLVFHSFAEGFAVLISFCLFIISWNTRKYSQTTYLTHVSIAFLFISVLDSLHMISYKGVNIFEFPNPLDPPTQFWLAARYLQSFSFLIALSFAKRSNSLKWAWIIYGTYTLLVIAAIFSGLFPPSLTPDTGLSSFKVYSEYLISVVFLFGTVSVLKSRHLTDQNSKVLLASSMILMLIAEIFFTKYISVYDGINHAGHVIKAVSFYLLYKSVIQTNLESPITMLFSGLNNENKHLLVENKDLSQKLIDQIYQLNIYKHAVDNSAIVAITDNNGKILSVNDQFCEISKYSRNELIGKTHKIINSGHHSKVFFKEMWETISSGNVWQGEIKNKAKDGSYYWVFTVITPLKNALGVVDRFIAIRHDISELKKQRDDIDKLQKMSAIGELSAKILHDTMNPLAIIEGKAKRMAKSIDQPDKERTLTDLNKITQSTQRIKDLFQNLRNNLLDQDTQAIKTENSLKDINVRTVIEKALSYCQDDERHSHCDIVVSNEVESDLIIYGSEPQLSQVFVNLFSNACEALSAQNITDKWIKIKSESLVDHYLIRVIDSGPGIPAEIREKIFEPLYSTKMASGGTGLGLDICKNIIIAHGGSIKVSPENSNTEFIISLPKPNHRDV